MKKYFPVPYPQESIESLVARYAMHTGQADMIQVYRYFFGTHSYSNQSSFNFIDNFYHRIKGVWKISFRDLVEKHTATMFDYPFENNPALHEFIQAKTVIGKTEENIEKFMINRRVIPNILKKSFNFCEACVKEDRNKYGEAYYKTIHDIDNVNYCMIHGNALSTACIRDFHRCKSLALEYLCQKNVEVDPPVSKTDMQKQYEILINKRFDEISSKRNLPYVNNIKWSNYYRDQIFQRYGFFRTEGETINALYPVITCFLTKNKISSYSDIICRAFLKIIRSIFPKRSRKLEGLNAKEHLCMWFMLLNNKNINDTFNEAGSCSDRLPYPKKRKNHNKITSFVYG